MRCPPRGAGQSWAESYIIIWWLSSPTGTGTHPLRSGDFPAQQDAVGYAIKLHFYGAKVGPGTGLFPYSDPDEASELTGSGALKLFDFRT
jgi:hypothetical protein